MRSYFRSWGSVWWAAVEVSLQRVGLGLEVTYSRDYVTAVLTLPLVQLSAGWSAPLDYEY